MFYSQFILAKKGPLGTIWIAAHLERKLRKNQVADTDIGVSVDSILCPDVPIALRLSSHLLVGVVRIYSRKVNYLFDDCSEALLKIKQAFRSAAVDLPPEESKAPYHSITLPETFDLDDFELPDNDIFQGNFVDHHISSREQITLQDTMEGVTYSTSKFGLDERFGDGDASGLDLDEELFLDKIGTAGHANESSDPQASVGPMTPHKQDEHPETRTVNSGTRVDGVDDYADLMDYAQAPCTPGLVEEPNISNVQEISACDDHLESEYLLTDEYGHRSGGLHINPSKTQGESPVEANMEHVSVESSSGSEPPSDLLGQVKPLNPASELGDKITCMEDLQNVVANKDKNSSLPVDETCAHHQGPYETGLEKSACEISGLTSTCHQVSEGVSPKDQGSFGVEVPGIVEIASGWEKPFPDASDLPSKSQDGSFPQNPETQACHEPADPSSLNLDVHEKVASSETFFLRPCNSNMEQPNITSEYVMSTDAAVQSDVTALATSGREETVMIGEACCRTDNTEEISMDNHIKEHTLQEDIHAASSKPDSQVMNASGHDRLVENLNNSAEGDLPAPEKLLSVPEGLADLHKNMVVEASPGVFVGLDEGDAGSKIVSGKKRSFTESTLTQQSLNSVESSRLVRFKRTVESVPDDDDLLSSILVGRSSVLKVKPTPRLSEVTSTKRTRSAPRTGAPKRKVLMDDTMVLHGDTIRQQLTNTEDIRRVRKKAPCTRPEISVIQKQYLEDEIFLEPLFTGMSIELASLHSQMHDLSGITVCKNDLNRASLEPVVDLRPPENVPSENDKDVSLETMAEPILSSNDVKIDDSLTTAVEPHLTPQNVENGERLDTRSEVAKSSESPLLSNNRMNEIDEMNVEINTCKEQTRPNSDVEADLPQQENLLDVTGVETGDKNDDAVNTVAGVKSLYSIGDASGDMGDASANVVQTNPIAETSETHTSVNADTSAGLPDQEKNAPSVELDSTVMDVDNGQVISRDAKDGDINAMVETEPLVRDDVLSEVAPDCGSVELLSNSKQGQLEYNEFSEIQSAILGENIVDYTYPAQVGLREDGFMDNGGSPEQPEAYQRYMMDVESSGFDLHDRDELKYSAARNDTEFLNVDDDDLTEVADDHIPDDEEERFIENTGWSSRTRAVSKYLQTLFVKEAECGRKSVSMDDVLIGKSRKEASRMFFEALVLKTRDYIHVEQRNPFDDITLKPRTRLMKSDF